jgi:hypothetical protein
VPTVQRAGAWLGRPIARALVRGRVAERASRRKEGPGDDPRTARLHTQKSLLPFPRADLARRPGSSGSRGTRTAKQSREAFRLVAANRQRDGSLRQLLVLSNENRGSADHDRSHRGIRDRLALDVQPIQRAEDLLEESLDLRPSRSP